MRGVLVGVVAVQFVGCDKQPKIVPVSGRVLLDGEPLTMGSVQFIHPATRPAAGAIRDDGRFILSTYKQGDGAAPGHYRVRVIASEEAGSDAVRWNAPKKYADEISSGIEFDIEGPVDDLVIELTWDGGKPFVER